MGTLRSVVEPFVGTVLDVRHDGSSGGRVGAELVRYDAPRTAAVFAEKADQQTFCHFGVPARLENLVEHIAGFCHKLFGYGPMVPASKVLRGVPIFKGGHFDRSVILLCVRWYLASNLSLCDLEEMIDHSTVHRWCRFRFQLRPERTWGGLHPGVTFGPSSKAEEGTGALEHQDRMC